MGLLDWGVIFTPINSNCLIESRWVVRVHLYKPCAVYPSATLHVVILFLSLESFWNFLLRRRTDGILRT